MPDMPTGFWAGWIAVVTLASLVALGWLVFSVYFSPDAEEEAEVPVWDETLEEGSNPAPMWWFWLILAAMVFSVVYLMLYPGLGSFSGALKWSQGGRLTESFTSYNERFGPVRKEIAGASLESLQADETIMASARRIFDRKCGICHGADGAGQVSRFPDLTDDVWQWGGDVALIEETIRNGRQAQMVGWQDVLGEEGVEQVAHFVRSLSDTSEVHDVSRGRELYGQFCIACHGAMGEGNIGLGAPNLTNDVWLYGGTTEDIETTIAFGRFGHMPAFEERLDDTQIRMLLAWLTLDR
jgi:cytochrome c oxidase cbb3-type subunit 3